MDVMTKYDLEPITKKYYDALEENVILGRRCLSCGHIEFPPYLCCNSCGGLDTEWVDLSNMKGVIKQALPTKGAFGDPDFRNAHGDYFAIEIAVPGADPVSTSLLYVDYNRYDEFAKLVKQEEVTAVPLIIKDEDVKVVVWQLEEGNEFRKMPDIKTLKKTSSAADLNADSSSKSVDDTVSGREENTENAVSSEAESSTKTAKGSEGSAPTDEIDRAIIACAAEAYGVDEAELTMATDIREDLSNESMKMIVMISQIEDELDVEIEIQEASLLNTLADFANRVREKLG